MPVSHFFANNWESLPNLYSVLSLAHVCACVTGLQHSELYQFGRFANNWELRRQQVAPMRAYCMLLNHQWREEGLVLRLDTVVFNYA